MLKSRFIKSVFKVPRSALRELIVRYEKWKKTNDAAKRCSIISNDISDSDKENPAMDDFDDIDDDGWEFDVSISLSLLALAGACLLTENI